MALIEVDEENFRAEMDLAFEKKHTVILKFGSEYCEPCHALECELEDIDDEMEDVSILMVDTSESPELAEQYDIYELPTMLIMKDRESPVHRTQGVLLSQDIEKIIKEN